MNLSPERMTSLRQFIFNELASSVPDRLLNDMLEPQYMPAWNRAFTHATASPNNYEYDEARGDRYYTAAFVRYITQALPDISNPGLVNDLIAYYLSGDYQAMIAERRGFQKYIVIASDLNQVTPKIIEDVFEAFAGVISDLGDKLGPASLGYEAGPNILKNYVTNIFNDIPLDYSLRGEPEAQLNTRLSKLGWKEESRMDFVRNGPRRTYIFLAKRYFGNNVPPVDPTRVRVLQELFRKENRTDANNYILIGVGEGSNRKFSRKTASHDALNFLNGAGYTADYANEVKLERDLSQDPQLRNLMTPIYNKYGKNLEFRKKDVDDGQELHMLYARNPDGSERVISYLVAGADEPNKVTKNRLIQLAMV